MLNNAQQCSAILKNAQQCTAILGNAHIWTPKALQKIFYAHNAQKANVFISSSSLRQIKELEAPRVPWAGRLKICKILTTKHTNNLFQVKANSSNLIVDRRLSHPQSNLGDFYKELHVIYMANKLSCHYARTCQLWWALLWSFQVKVLLSKLDNIFVALWKSTFISFEIIW